MIFVGPFQLNCFFFSCHLLMMLHSTETVLTPGVHWPSSGLCWTHYNHTGGSASSHSTTQFSHPAHTPTCSFSMKVQQETASKPLMNSIQTISTTPPIVQQASHFSMEGYWVSQVLFSIYEFMLFASKLFPGLGLPLWFVFPPSCPFWNIEMVLSFHQ